MGLSDEEWQKHVEFVNAKLEELGRDKIDSRTVCGRLERGWVRWSADRRAQQRHLVRELWEAESAGIPREAEARFLGGMDSTGKLMALADPDFGVDPRDFFIIDAYWVEQSMTQYGMSLQIDGLSPMECSWLIREEACELCERLAQLAFADRCNVLYLINTAYMADGAAFMRERCDLSDVELRYGPPPDENADTIRALIYRHLETEAPFTELVEALVTRWRTRPAKPDGPVTWQEIFNRAEQRRDDDDLYWISAAEDLGLLTVEQTDAIFAAIDSAAGTGDAPDGADHAPSGIGEGFQHFSGPGLFRVATSGSPRLQQYWGARAGWIPISPGCRGWSDDPQNDERYEPVDYDAAASIAQRLDTQAGGAFWGGLFWFDDADSWTVERARSQAAELEDQTKNLVMYWTWQEYQSDLNQLARLRTFLQAADYEKAADEGDAVAMRELGVLLATRWNPPDLTRSRKWLEKAAVTGDTEAMLNLGTLLADRWDPPDLPGARAWYERAAAAGNPAAMSDVGVLLTTRWDPPDLDTARDWFEKAAGADHVAAMYYLGLLYARHFKPPDLAAARTWFEKAAAAGSADAAAALDILRKRPAQESS